MTRNEFEAVVKAFFQGPQPYRHLYLWHGEAKDLMRLLPSGRVRLLDLFRLAAELSHHPFAQDEAGELLRDAIQAELMNWHGRGVESHPVLVVTGCELLARYWVGLQPFYQVLTDRSMVVLVCSAANVSYEPAGRLPDYVHCEPGATLSYLSRLVEENHVVAAS